jgi:alpha-amylase/alpha-mannosidase (GH57 family)
MNVVFSWHMHQPWYKVGENGSYILPWVYLHALKDYSDMAAHLERHPAMRAVVNFTPVLLLQLEDYVERLRQHLDTGSMIGDTLLDYLAGTQSIPTDTQKRAELAAACLRAHRETMIDPWPHFAGLANIANQASDNPKLLDYLGNQFFVDLLVWYHLAWVGFAGRFNPVFRHLSVKASQFSVQDRRDFIRFIYDELRMIIPRYNALIHNGQVELSITPWGHPIAPLLKDFENIRCSQPHDPLPPVHYPDGGARVRWHIEECLKTAERVFEIRPRTVWMGEGAISAISLTLLSDYGFIATASGESVWRNSSRISGHSDTQINSKKDLFFPHHHDGSPINVFFRDDGLSDLIGFEYSSWKAEDAAGDFVQHLQNIHHHLGEEADNAVVSIILDGENAWEYYPDNGWDFLEKLYQNLTSAEHIHITTFGACHNLPSLRTLHDICPGSWVYGSFSTWIGDKDKNRAWELLVAARHAYDHYLETQTVSNNKREQLEKQLGVCEGSDWFWWFGDYNPGDSVTLFDKLYRAQLSELYRLMNMAIPPVLNHPVSVGNQQQDHQHSGTMRRN